MCSQEVGRNAKQVQRIHKQAQIHIKNDATVKKLGASLRSYESFNNRPHLPGSKVLRLVKFGIYKLPTAHGVSFLIK
jgi:hypothetical protein